MTSGSLGPAVRPTGAVAHGRRSLVVAAAGCVVATAAVVVYQRAASAGYPGYSPVEAFPVAVAFGLGGGLLMRYPGASAVGRVLLACGLLADAALALVASGAARWSVSGEEVSIFEDLAGVASFLATALLFGLLPQVFPDGLLRGRGWRVLAVLTVAGGCVTFLGLGLTSRYGSGRASELAFSLWTGWAVLAVAIGLGTLVVRWRRADRRRRRQVLPGVVSVAALLVLLAASWAAPAVGVVLTDELLVTVWVGLTLVVVAVGIARHQLFGIDVRLRRALLFAVGVAVVAATFGAVCVALMWSVTSVGLGAGRRWGVAAAGATASVVVAAATSLGLVRLMRRHLLGQGGSALPMLARLGDTPSEETTGDLAAIVAVALRSPEVRLTSSSGERSVVGDDQGLERVRVPLALHGERLGELEIAPRSPGEPYSVADQRLIGLLAHEAAVHLSLRRRDEEVQSARRTRLEELATERARIGRDLHDGLAPLLAGASLSAEALRRGMPVGSEDERDAARLADRLRSAARETRRVAHALQPAALDLGLRSAVEEHLAGLADLPSPTFDLVSELDPLPPDVTSVAYLVVLEGVNNALQHARARRVEVRLVVVADALEVAVSDDGVGLATPYVSGLGIRSMRERVAGLGGRLAVVQKAGGGTSLTATIPLA